MSPPSVLRRLHGRATSLRSVLIENRGRRRWACRLGAALFLFAPVLGALSAACAASPALPNIVILYADDMGYGDLAIQNSGSKIPTPHLDQLARDGMRFTDAHSSSGICSPSRYALLTGRYHWRKFHDIVDSFGPSVFAPGELTLARMLQEKGYHTACIGKWHLGWDWKALMKPDASPNPGTGYSHEAFDWSKRIPGGPLAHGFDYYFGDDVPNFPPYTWIENDQVLTEPDSALHLPPRPAEGGWEARPGPMVEGWDFYAVMPRLTEKCVSWIREQRKSAKPFFLFFPWTSPHAPIVPAKPFRGKTEGGPYGDYVMQSDTHAGQVLQALDEAGFRTNTLVIFTSDNGPEGYAYERIRKTGHRSMGSLRGLKRDLWEGGHRVPFVVRWPGVVKPGTVSDELISQIDLMATLAGAVGYTLPKGIAEDSLNLLPIWHGETDRSPRSALVYNTMRNKFAIRQGSWVLVNEPPGNTSKVPPWFDAENGYVRSAFPGELYDLRSDFSQRTNLFSAEPAKASELKRLLRVTRNRGQAQAESPSRQ